MAATPGHTGTQPLLSVADVGAVLGVSRATIHRLARTGALPVVKVAGRSLFREADVEAFIERSVRRGGHA